jgi:AcrR family transcriptional regulator
MDQGHSVDAARSGSAAQATSRGGRSAPLGEAREQEILRAAYDLLGEVGYEGLRFDAVAARARASKATLYRHWPGKAQLIADAVKCCKASAMDVPDTGSLRGDLVALLTMMAESMAGEDGPLLAGLVMAMQSDPEFASEMRATYESKQVVIESIVSRAASRGELRSSCDSNLIEEIAPAQLFMHSFAFGEPLDAKYIDHLVDDILLPLLIR